MRPLNTYSTISLPPSQPLALKIYCKSRSQLADGDTNEAVGQTFLNCTFDDRRPWLSPAGRNRTAVRILVILILLGGAAAWLQSEARKSQLADWVGKQSENVSSKQGLP